MTNPSENDNLFVKAAETIPFPDLGRVGEMNGTLLNEIAKFNAQVGANMQSLGKEWSEFVGLRLREDVHFFRSIHDCRSMQDIRLVYVQFWQTAFTQYSEEAHRMMRLTQGTAEDMSHASRDIHDTVIQADKAA